MQMTIDEFQALQKAMSSKEVEIALMRKEMEQRSEPTETTAGQEADAPFICISLKNVFKVFHSLKGNVAYSSFLFFALQKMMPEAGSEGVMKRIADAASLDVLPVTITAKGDIRVDGDFNDIHDNDNVAV